MFASLNCDVVGPHCVLNTQSFTYFPTFLSISLASEHNLEHIPGNLKLSCIDVMFLHPHAPHAKKSGFYLIRTVPLWKHPSYRFPCFLSLWKLRSQVKEVIKLIQTQQKKDFATANRSVKSNRDLPKRLWRVGEVHTNLEISMLSFLLLGKSLDLFEEDKSTKYEENNSRMLDSAKHSSEGNKVEEVESF